MAHLRRPDFDVPRRPHPASARRPRSGVLLTPFGDVGQTLWVVIAFLSLGALAWVTYELGAHWFGPAAGAVAGLRDPHPHPGPELRRAGVRRHPVRRAGAGRDPRRGARPQPARRCSSCSPSPGLLRPEAWLFSFAYVAWKRDLRLLPLGGRGAGASGWRTTSSWPATRCTRCSAPATTRRPCSASPASAPSRGRSRAGSARSCASPACSAPPRAGCSSSALHAARARRCRSRPASSRSPRSACWPPPACRSSAATCCSPPRCSRSSAARARSGGCRSTATTRGGPRWAAIGAAVLAAFVGLRARPGRPDPRPARLDAHAGRRSSPTCTRSRDDVPCRPVAVPNHRPVPHVALWTGIPPGEIVSAQLEQPTRGAYIDPANERVQRNFTLDPNDPKRLTATVPPGFEGVASNGSWLLYASC